MRTLHPPPFGAPESAGGRTPLRRVPPRPHSLWGQPRATSSSSSRRGAASGSGSRLGLGGCWRPHPQESPNSPPTRPAPPPQPNFFSRGKRVAPRHVGRFPDASPTFVGDPDVSGGRREVSDEVGSRRTVPDAPIFSRRVTPTANSPGCPRRDLPPLSASRPPRQRREGRGAGQDGRAAARARFYWYEFSVGGRDSAPTALLRVPTFVTQASSRGSARSPRQGCAVAAEHLLPDGAPRRPCSAGHGRRAGGSNPGAGARPPGAWRTGRGRTGRGWR